jgi:hypothetical protein
VVFYFGEKAGDELMSKINLRSVASRAKQWDHPVKGLLHKYAPAMRATNGNILTIPKKVRELYAICIAALALITDTHKEWWVNIPPQDPPDGLIMTLTPHTRGSVEGLKGFLREFEVVEHRDEPHLLFKTIEKKMTAKAYGPDFALICLVLTPQVYDLESLSLKLQTIDSSLVYVFVVFAGAGVSDLPPKPEKLSRTLTMSQLLPRFGSLTFDLVPHLEDFQKKYDAGQESRLMDQDIIYFGTTNPKRAT